MQKWNDTPALLLEGHFAKLSAQLPRASPRSKYSECNMMKIKTFSCDIENYNEMNFSFSDPMI